MPQSSWRGAYRYCERNTSSAASFQPSYERLFVLVGQQGRRGEGYHPAYVALLSRLIETVLCVGYMLFVCVHAPLYGFVVGYDGRKH